MDQQPAELSLPVKLDGSWAAGRSQAGGSPLQGGGSDIRELRFRFGLDGDRLSEEGGLGVLSRGWEDFR